MAKQFAPKILEADYITMRDLMIDRSLPLTFVEWRHMDDRQTSYWNRTAGDDVEHVEVTPAEFLAFCFDRGWPQNLASLDRYVWDKARSMIAS